MARNGMVPPVTLKGARVPTSRFAEFEPHKVQMKTVKVNGMDTSVPDLDPPNVARTDTPAAEEAQALLARRGGTRLR